MNYPLLKNILLLLLLLFPFEIYSQRISSIRINGNKEFSVQEISSFADVIGLKPDSNSIDSAKKNISRNYADRGFFHITFYNIQLKQNDSLNYELQLSLNEGKPTYINLITFSGITGEDSLRLSKLLYDLTNEIFNKFLLEEVINNYLIELENRGFPFAKFAITSIVLQDSNDISNAIINLQIDKGQLSKIDKIEIQGNESTEDFVITRELRFIPGEPYAQYKIENIPASLNRLRFFEPIQVPSYYINGNGEGVLQITVKEKQTNNFDGVLGYIPGINENDNGYITGLVNLSMRNLFGTGRAALIRWQQLNRNSQELELRYLEPWIFGFPFNISTGLFQRKQDTTYVQREIEGAINFLATKDFSLGLSISTQDVIPNLGDTTRFTVYKSNSLTTGVNLFLDSRDDPYAPTKGLFFTAGYSFSQKEIKGPLKFITPEQKTDINLQRISLTLTGYYEFFNRQVGAASVNVRELRGDSFEESDLFRLGGTNTLRGYREQQFTGSRIFWSNLEYRYLLTRRSYAFLFFDTGYFLRVEELSKSIPKLEGFRIGYGGGIQIETGIGVLSVSYALAKGEGFGDGKIHFGFINDF